MYQVVNPDGSKFDAVGIDVLKQWAGENRIGPNTPLFDPISGQTVMAGSLPDLVGCFTHHSPQGQAGHSPQATGGGMPATGGLSSTGMILGIVVACLAFVGLIPCLGWMNWFTLLLGGVANILCWVAVFTEGSDPAKRSKAIIGLVVTFVACAIGFVRLILGGGCL